MLRSLAAFILVLAIALPGVVTVKNAPGCNAATSGPNVLKLFVEAIVKRDFFAAQHYALIGPCSGFNDSFPATIVDEGSQEGFAWIKVRVEVEGFDPIEVYTIPEGVK